MSIQARWELTMRVRPRYQQASWKEKSRILDEFVASTGYDRKYAIGLLRNGVPEPIAPKPRRPPRRYDESVRVALLAVWNAANRICSKRLVPFLPEIVSAMEHHGHLSIPDETRKRLLSMSVSTVDRLLHSERLTLGAGISATRPGSLLKTQIPVRTFADWNETAPGFFEADLVVHCGDQLIGSFLSTLVLTDIASGWTECRALMASTEADVTGALDQIRADLPIALLGLDTDNGHEFINWSLFRYCEKATITFTRSRTYRKNDQTHVEEKNGSVVRRLVGYDRLEGIESWRNLASLYNVMRLYVNYFQPSLKLVSKQRDGAKVRKRYDRAQTPCQRLLASEKVAEEIKAVLRKRYEELDPVALLREIERRQDRLWAEAAATRSVPHPATDLVTHFDDTRDPAVPGATSPRRAYRRTKKERVPHTWRTRNDPFEDVWTLVCLQLEIDPAQTTKALFDELRKEYPGRFTPGQLRTLQRRVKEWRRQHLYRIPDEEEWMTDSKAATNERKTIGESDLVEAIAAIFDASPSADRPRTSMNGATETAVVAR